MVAFSAFIPLFATVSAVCANWLPFRPGKCDVSGAKPDLPSDQTNVTVPAGQFPLAITLGVGVQNYTCSDAGKYASAGAVATLFDISCIFGSPEYSTITKVAYDIWNGAPTSNIGKVAWHLAKNFPVFADHYFTTSPSGTGISPVFDARATSRKGDPEAYILASKAGGLPAPTGTQDVDWLQLSNVQGNLSTTVLRIDTKLGQPPSSCTPGSGPISVKYTTVYWFLS